VPASAQIPPSAVAWWLAAVQPFAVGGIGSCVATTVVQPVDCIKVRIQVLGEGTRAEAPGILATARSILRSEGVAGLYAGLSASYLRQLVYGSARLGLFRKFSDAFRERNAGQPLAMWQKVAAGLFSGATASLIGNPADVALVRMQSDSALPEAQRRHYKGVGDALTRIVREEGVLGLWRGSTPTVVRATVLNASMMATSDQLKESLAPVLGARYAMATVLISSVVSGVAAATASLPFDMVRRAWPLAIGTHSGSTFLPTLM